MTNHKKVIVCECGLEINYYNRKSHYNTKKHINRLNNTEISLIDKKIKTNEDMLNIIEERKLRKKLTTEIWKINNASRHKKYYKDYYQKNKKVINERAKSWQEKNKLNNSLKEKNSK